MAKKMTLKEFKTALLEQAGMDFEVWGWDGLLNLIACEKSYEYEIDSRLGFDYIAQDALEKRNRITSFLEARGYYDK